MIELNKKIEKLRQELNELYSENGLNDLIIRKSQELDELIIQSQRYIYETTILDKKYGIA